MYALPFTRKCRAENLQTVAGKSCLQSGANLAADGVEGGVEFGRQGAHTGDCAESDQGDHEGVFHEVLAFFAGDHVLHRNVQLHHHILHFQSLLSLVWSSHGPAALLIAIAVPISQSLCSTLEFNNLALVKLIPT